MSQHTKGPWETNRGGVQGPQGEPICAGQFNATLGVTLETWNANAKLIAAAPELLKLVMQFREDLLACYAYGFSEKEAALLERSKAVIEKATL